MGWFGEQLHERQKNDNRLFEESLKSVAWAISGGGHGIEKEGNAIDDILSFYHFKPAGEPIKKDIPIEKCLDRMLGPYGIMYRRVRLVEGWQKDSYDPLLGFKKEDNEPIALFPGAFSGYWYWDDEGKRKSFRNGDSSFIKEKAYCFYKPLPQRPIGRFELIRFMMGLLDGADIISFLCFVLIGTLVGMVLPKLTRFLGSVVLSSGDFSLLWASAFFAGAVLLSGQMLQAIKTIAMERMRGKFSGRLLAAVMMRVLNLPASFFKDYSSGDLARRVDAAEEFSDLLWGGSVQTIIAAVASLLYIRQLFLFAPCLAGPSLLVVFAMLLVILSSVWLGKRVNKRRTEYEARERGIAYSIITGIQKIKLAGAEKRAFYKWASEYRKEAAYTYDPPLFMQISPAIILLVSLLGEGAMYYIAAKEGVLPSDYMAFLAAFGMLSSSFLGLSDSAGALAEAEPLLLLLEPIMQENPQNAAGKEIIEHISGGIELSHVYFRYNKNMPFLARDISLNIKPGEYVAIVGKTGSGKSTLLRLLLGFESPERGAIYYDGKDISKVDQRSLRSKVGVVTQNGGLFQGDIFSNIVISKPNLSLDEAWEAARLAGIEEDIRAMPMGMHTIIGEGSGGISGGQKQRLMIARAIAPRPKILMFDEATSALDNKTQRLVTNALDSLKCTRLVIAHRLSTIQSCDRILVLDDGRVVEDGTYEELLKNNGLFSELVERQRIDEGEYVGKTMVY